MEKQELLETKRKVLSKNKEFESLSKKEIALLFLKGCAYLLLGFLFSCAEMPLGTRPLGFALLGACNEEALWVLVGMIASSFEGGKFSLSLAMGSCLLIGTRLASSLFIDKKRSKEGVKKGVLASIYYLFTENTHLKVMSCAIGVFFVGVFRIVEGGFRFYDLFASILYLVASPLATFIFSKYYTVQNQKREKGHAFAITPTSQRLLDISTLAILSALTFSLSGIELMGISVPLFFAVFLTLLATKKGFIHGIVAGLSLGLSVSLEYAPMLGFCAISYMAISKISLLGASLSVCITGLAFGIYVHGIGALGSDLPALLSSSLVFGIADRLDIFEDVKRFILGASQKSIDFSEDLILAREKIISNDERIRQISDSFSSLSEIFYNLSSRLKRPSMLDLHSICEESFEKHCDGCENRTSCFGAEYPMTLEAIKKTAVLLHSHGFADERKLPEGFRRKCLRKEKIIKDANTFCATETKKAFKNEKTEIFALDYDAISNILNDAIAENEDEFKTDVKMGKRISKIISDLGYGEHSVMVFGKRKLKIIARNLDIAKESANISTLIKAIENAVGMKLTQPSFDLSFGSVNMSIEAKRAFSADCAFSSLASEGESICGDTVSIFENKNDYLYALISDGMGTGRNAALTSETCNVFLRNMLSAGNRMETSLKMLNSVLRTKISKSEDECSATIDLLQLDLYSGALTLVKSGAAPTFVLRRENVFKLASPSLPIGILRSLDAKQTSIGCEDGDLVVMLSDGAIKNGDDCSFITSILSEKDIADEPSSRIADKIIRRARAEADLQNDDISVVVIKIKKEICNW